MPSHRHQSLVAAALALSVPLLACCANLPPLTADVCGDGVVNPGEDCDGAHGDGGVSCGAPDSGALACRYNCAGSAVCPAGYGCGVDDICRAPSGAFEPLGAPLGVGASGVTLADFNDDGFADALTHGAPNAVGGVRVELDYLKSDGTVLGTFAIDDRLSGASVADVNGDGIPDLVGALRIGTTSGVSVFLGRPSTSLAVQAFPSTVVPTAATPSGASVRALAIVGFSAGPRVAYFLGSSGGAYAPGLYIPAGAAPLPDIASPGVTRVISLPEGPDATAGDVVLAQIHAGASALSSPCPSVIYATRGSAVRVLSPCVVSNGETDFDVGQQASTVNLPASVTTCVDAANGECGTGVRVGDFNMDGLPDLIVTGVSLKSMNGFAYTTYVAYGDGTGGFASQPPGFDGSVPGQTSGPIGLTLRSSDGALVTHGVTLGRTLAVGDINGDGVSDFVAEVNVYGAADGGAVGSGVSVLVSELVPSPPVDAGFDAGFDAGAPSELVYGNAFGTQSWTSAAIGDFNGDGTADVVGGSSQGGIDFYTAVQVAAGVYTGHHSVIATTGGTSTFAVGDYDGDGLDDLAFQEVDASNDGTADVAIAYGNASGSPGPAVAVGRFPAVVQIAGAAPYPILELVTAAGVAGGEPAAPFAVTELSTAAAGRPPLSSVALSPSDADAGTVPQAALAAVAGNFGASPDVGSLDGGSSPKSVAAFGQELGISADGGVTPSDYLWLVPGLGASSDSAVTFGPPAPGGGVVASNFSASLGTSTNASQALLVAAGALGTSGVDSVVAVGSALGDPTQAVLVVATPSGSSPATLSPTNLDGGAAPVLSIPMGDAGLTASSVAGDGQVGLVDLDGDGYPDLVLLTGTSVGATCAAIDGNSSHAESTARALVVFWNDTHGGFDLAGPVVVASCGAEACGLGTKECPEAFAAAGTADSMVPALAFVTREAVHVARFTSSRQLLAVGGLSSVPAPADGGVTGADAGALLLGVTGFDGIAAGDVNGDGVGDLAVTAGGAVYLLAGVPVNR